MEGQPGNGVNLDKAPMNSWRHERHSVSGAVAVSDFGQYTRLPRYLLDHVVCALIARSRLEGWMNDGFHPVTWIPLHREGGRSPPAVAVRAVTAVTFSG